MIQYFLTVQFLKFLLVGGSAAALHWFARYWLSNWVSFPLAVAMAYTVGIAVAFILNHRYVFPTSERPVKKQARDFILVNLAFFPIVWGAALLFRYLLIQAEVIYFVDGLSHGLAILLPVFLTFLIYKFFAFGDK